MERSGDSVGTHAVNCQAYMEHEMFFEKAVTQSSVLYLTESKKTYSRRKIRYLVYYTGKFNTLTWVSVM